MSEAFSKDKKAYYFTVEQRIEVAQAEATYDKEGMMLSIRELFERGLGKDDSKILEIIKIAEKSTDISRKEIDDLLGRKYSFRKQMLRRQTRRSAQKERTKNTQPSIGEFSLHPSSTIS